MKNYLVEGRNPDGQAERAEVVVDEPDGAVVLEVISQVAATMFDAWDQFTITVEALDNEPVEAETT